MRDTHNFIWRIATDDDTGPYQALHALPMEGEAFLYSHPDMWADHADAEHPNPWREPMAKSRRKAVAVSDPIDAWVEEFLNVPIPDSLGERMDLDHKWWKFGHATIEQARKWWSPEDVQYAKAVGAKWLEAYAVSDVKAHLDGKHQTVFEIPNRKAGEMDPDPKPVLRVPVEDLYALPPAELEREALAAEH